MSEAPPDPANGIEQRKRRVQRDALFGLMGISLAILGVVWSFIGVVREFKPGPRLRELTAASASRAELQRVATDVTALRKSVVALEAHHRGPVGTPLAETRRLMARTKALEERLARLEVAIQATPEKALAVPVLRIQLDTMDKRMAEQRAETARETDRLYAILLWLLGALLTLAIAAVTGAFGIWRALSRPNGSGGD